MPTIVSDTIKPRSDFPIGYSTDIQVDVDDNRTVKEALSDAGTIASKDNLGIVKIGSGIDVVNDTDNPENNGIISVPIYADISNEEPNKDDENILPLLFIDTSKSYINPNTVMLKNYNRYEYNKELVVGCWVNGKPIYRRVFEAVTPSANNVSTSIINTADYDIDEVIKLDGYIIAESGASYINLNMHFSETAYTVTWYGKSTNYIKQKVYNYTSCPQIIIIEYTKSSDSNQSFNDDIFMDSMLDNEVNGQDIIDIMGD